MKTKRLGEGVCFGEGGLCVRIVTLVGIWQGEINFSFSGVISVAVDRVNEHL